VRGFAGTFIANTAMVGSVTHYRRRKTPDSLICFSHFGFPLACTRLANHAKQRSFRSTVESVTESLLKQVHSVEKHGWLSLTHHLLSLVAIASV